MTLTEHWDDWYSLDASNWSAIEGTGDEWLAIADAIEHRHAARFKRCAVRFEQSSGFFIFHSPRNCCGEQDVELIAECEAAETVAAIREAVMKNRPHVYSGGLGI